MPLITRRDFVHAGCAVAAAALFTDPVDARFPRGSSAGAVAPTRVLLACYGQSNTGTFALSAQSQSPLVPPPANAATSYYNGSSIVNPIAPNTVGDGIITCMNQINNVTGLPVVFLVTAVGGSGVSGFIPGTSAFTNLIAQINAVILPTDYVIVLWDQGEGDANAAPPEQPQDYIDSIKLVRDGIASSLGRPNVALLVAGLGTTSFTAIDGQPSGGNSPHRWQQIKNAHFFTGIQIPHVYYSGTNIDVVRTTNAGVVDVYHYCAPTIDGIGQRFAQATTNLMGIGSPGFAHWEIGSTATVDATHTNVNLVHSLGTDFTPTTGADGWEVSGDNGANWVTATGARNNSTQLQLTHSSISTTSARLVRYQWGFNQNGISASPTPNLLRDNSSLTVPLTPTTWDIRATGASSTVPCATWRNIDTVSRTPNTLSRNTRKLLCFPSTDNYQKFIILAMYSGYPPSTGPALTMTVTPDGASPVTANFVGEHPTSGMSLFQAQLGSDANASTYLTVNVALASDPSTDYTIEVFDVPLASLNSTTNTGTNSATTTLAANTAPPLTSNCTVNVSAGGLMIAMNVIDVNQTTAGAFATYSSNFNNRREGGQTVTLDAANSAANAASPFSISFGTTNPSSPINMYTFMAAWR